MKSIFLILAFSYCISYSFGQKTFNQFKGDLTFKDSWFYAHLTRQIWDTMISYSIYNKMDSTVISQYAAISENNSLTIEYLPFKYLKNGDSLFVKYYNPLTKTNIVNAAFSLNSSDTLTGGLCYKFLLDSLIENGKLKYYIDACNDEPDELSIIFRGDTTFRWKEYEFSCYIFEEQKIESHPRGADFRRIILFEKELLLPIDIQEFTFLNKANRWNQNMPREKWLLSRHFKLIFIDPD